MRYLVVFVILASIWFAGGSFAISAKNKSAYFLSEVLAVPKQWLLYFFQPILTYEEQEKLKWENEVLKAEVFALKQANVGSDKQFLKAKIYSRYPLNDKNLLSINLGSGDGVKRGMPATINGSILLGRVEAVFDDYSLVKTIFTSGWQIPVRIGERAVEGVVEGGIGPAVAMIAKDQEIIVGEAVFAASKNFPYGIKIGEVGAIRKGIATGVFQEASLVLPYNVNNLDELWLIKSF